MISIVIPNFNSGHLLVKNLPKLFKLLEQSKLEHEIIVSDDASTDDSLSVLKSLEPSHYKLVTSSVNTGFGSNVDRGIRAAKGEVVFILNAIDIIPKESDYFKLMLEHFKDPEVFSVAAAKQEKETHGCGEIYFKRGFFLHRHRHPGGSPAEGGINSATDRIYPEKILSPFGLQNDVTAWADGGAQALRKAYYFKIGGFDSIYKFYWEDVDLGYRAWSAGYKIIYEPKAVLLHEKKAGPIAKNYSESELRIMNLYGQFVFTWKNADLRHLLLYNLWEPYYFLVALKNRDWDWFKAYWQASQKSLC